MLQWWKGNKGSLTDPAGSPISPITYDRRRREEGGVGVRVIEVIEVLV